MNEEKLGHFQLLNRLDRFQELALEYQPLAKEIIRFIEKNYSIDKFLSGIESIEVDEFGVHFRYSTCCMGCHDSDSGYVEWNFFEDPIAWNKQKLIDIKKADERYSLMQKEAQKKQELATYNRLKKKFEGE